MHSNRRAPRSGGPGHVAVLTADGLYSVELGLRPCPLPRSLLECHELAAEHGIRQLWWTPGAIAVAGLPAELEHHPAAHSFLECGRLIRPPAQTVLGSWLSVWGADDKSASHYLEVAVPSWDRGSPFAGESFGPCLLGEVLTFVEATGMLWRRSGAITSDSWLRTHWGPALRATEYPEVASAANLEPDAVAHRRAEGTELRARYCHAFDANAMYLGAMSSLALPVGPCDHWHSRRAGIPDPHAPAYWHNGDRWLTTPTLAHKREDGFVELDEAYSWSESHRYLEPLYRVLRDARTALLGDGPSPALEAVKQVYRQGVGRFGSTRRTIEADRLYQPYWRHAVQAEARERLYRRVAKLAQTPVAIEVDCLYFLTSSPSPGRFAARIGLPLGTGVGAFKWAGSLPGKRARTLLEAERSRETLRGLREEATK